VAALAATLAAGAHAQGPPSPSNPLPPTATQPEPRDCARLPVKPPSVRGDLHRRDETVGERPPLSEQFARSDGVLCPPQGVDPDIRAPTPDAGRGRVIRPPGSGDPTMRLK